MPHMTKIHHNIMAETSAAMSGKLYKTF